MDVTVNNLSDVSREVEIVVTTDELQPHFEQAYREYQPKVQVKGFRKGKVPLELVKKLYGEAIEYESLETVAVEVYRQTVKERDLKPIGEPMLVDMDYRRGDHFRFKIQYDVRPTIMLKEYTGFTVEKPVHRVTAQEVENELLRLRRMNSTTADTDRVTDAEHIVIADVQELDETGFPIIGKKTENARFYLADETLEQPIRDTLLNAERGGEYRVQFDHTHDDHSHRVDLRMTVTRVQKVILPPLDDTLVAKITKDKITTVEEFRKSLEADLNAYWESRSRRQLVGNLVGEILRRHDFEVPESLTRSVLSGLLEQLRNEYPNRQLPDDFDTRRFVEQNRAYAIAQAKWALLREEIIRAENIQVSDDDLAAIAEREAASLGLEKERLLSYYKSSEQMREKLVGEKLTEFLLKNVKIKEVEEHQHYAVA